MSWDQVQSYLLIKLEKNFEALPFAERMTPLQLTELPVSGPTVFATFWYINFVGLCCGHSAVYSSHFVSEAIGLNQSPFSAGIEFSLAVYPTL